MDIGTVSTANHYIHELACAYLLFEDVDSLLTFFGLREEATSASEVSEDCQRLGELDIAKFQIW